jgi:hypothetical protein
MDVCPICGEWDCVGANEPELSGDDDSVRWALADGDSRVIDE